MIQLKPFVISDCICPECHEKLIQNRGILIEGSHVVADNHCESCGFDFLQLLPVSHTVNYPIAYGKLTKKIYDADNSWVSRGLPKYFAGSRSEDVKITRTVYKKCRDVVLLNTLDFLYGHSLLKLFNAQYHLDHEKESGLIVIISRNFEWLIPGGCAEVWVVDIRQSDLRYSYHSINRYISGELQRFDNVYLSKAYSHPDFAKISISRFTGVEPFALRKFSSSPIHITFVLREDRWWINSMLSYRIFQILRKCRLGSMAVKLLSTGQNILVKATIEKVRKKLPSAAFYIVGLGTNGNFEGIAMDMRRDKVPRDVEAEWCRLYAKSQVVIGIHGSNMILPTAHAAGCIEILPQDRIPNIVQDIAVRHSDRRQLFLYRFVSQFASAQTVASHIVSIISGYDIFYTNMCSNLYTGHYTHDND